MGATTSGPERPGGAKLSSRQAFSDSENVTVTREKKKKLSKLATLRKKLIRGRRHSRNYDHAKAIRELTSSWTVRELNALVDEYQALSALKDLTVQADQARPSVNTFKKDLSDLYDFKYCTDVDLIYQGVCFPVHRAIVSARCHYFRSLLSKYSGYGTQVPVKIRTPGVDVNMFSALLRYLYTGEFYHDDPRGRNSLDTLLKLGEEFGTLNHLESDMQALLESGDYCDAILVFTSDLETQDFLHPDSASEVCNTKTELHCHKAILAARSPFFRNLLLRRVRSGEEATDRALQTASRIILDESIIPKQYARVLLHAIYLDVVDVSCIVRNSSSTCSLSEVQAMVSGKSHATQIEQAMEIYQIGQFLDFPVLSQGCEDIIVDSINTENLVSILSWGSEPHGSQYVHRQALHHLREEFVHVAHTQVLYDISKEYLIEIFKSDFTQASELEILSATLKWGEFHLIKRMEEREPNLLTHTAHSVKKGIKKRDLNDIELRDILSEILPYIRVDHVVPPSNDILNNAIKRGLVSSPPSHMISDVCGRSRASTWIRGRSDGMFVKPRLFMPYFEEVKTLLEDQLTQVTENDLVRLRTFHMSSVPDTLYMLGDRVDDTRLEPSPCTVDIIAGTIPVPNHDTIKQMCRRENHLKNTKSVLHAGSLKCADRSAICYQVQLQVVRETGLPDNTVEVLQTVQLYSDPDPMDLYHYTPRRSPSAPGPLITSPYYSSEKEPSVGGDSILSEIMPDIAMATSSSLKKNSVHNKDSDLADKHSFNRHCNKGSPGVAAQKLDIAMYNSLESRRKKKYSSCASPDVAKETCYHDSKLNHTSKGSPDVTLDSKERVMCGSKLEYHEGTPRPPGRNFSVTDRSPDVSSCLGKTTRQTSQTQGDPVSPDVAMGISHHSTPVVSPREEAPALYAHPDVTGQQPLGLDLTHGASNRPLPRTNPKTTEELQAVAASSLQNGQRKRVSPDVAMGASVLALRDFPRRSQCAESDGSAPTPISPDVTPSLPRAIEGETEFTSNMASPDIASDHVASPKDDAVSPDSSMAPSAEEEDCDSLNGTLYL